MSESEPVAACTLADCEAFQAADVKLMDRNADGEPLGHSCSVESLLTAASDGGPPALGPPQSSRSVFRQGDALQPRVLSGNNSKDKLSCDRPLPRLESHGSVLSSNTHHSYAQREEQRVHSFPTVGMQSQSLRLESHGSVLSSNTHHSYAQREEQRIHSFPNEAMQSQSLSSESIIHHSELLDKFSSGRQSFAIGSSSDILPMTKSSKTINVDSHWVDRPLVQQLPILPRADQAISPSKATGHPVTLSRATSTDSSMSSFTGHHFDGIQPMTATDPTLTPMRPLETPSEVATAMGLVTASQHCNESSTPAFLRIGDRHPMLPTDGSSGSVGGLSAVPASEQRVKSPTWVIEEIIVFGDPADDNVREVEDSGDVHRCIAVAASGTPCADRNSGLFGECTQTCNEERGCQ